ncbi:putative valacyclovir hydrolase [Microdochium bolleyi]|uniref:Putative valacyclovir hydrolase n=1 Tax=Microdochium bolleyi TaxID=196109 RepID=A0A136IQW0_9PEZI|nr:putative valacyclovir hydrolase [Microdochium bolleyi]
MPAPSRTELVVLPRPGTAAVDGDSSPIAGPLQSDFTTAFGSLLPAAQYITTPKGRFAYYDLPPSPTASETTLTPASVQRVLLIHGVQTPALGLHPLATDLRAAFPATHFVLFDLWGHGLSDTPRVQHVPELFLEQVDTLLDHLSWPSAHLVGYSLGSTIAAGYTATRTVRVESVVYVAPAGLFGVKDFSADQQVLLRGDAGEGEVDELATRDFVMSFLEGGELVVPADAAERIAKGEVVAEAVRDWEMKNHPGHAGSVVAIVRDGGVMDREETFRQASASGKAMLAVLGEKDDITSLEKVRNVGVEAVVVVNGAGHGVVRLQAGEVARAIGQFWTRS